MDGIAPQLPRYIVLTLSIVSTAACSGLDPEPSPVPYALYDSPVVAGQFEEAEADDDREFRAASETASSASDDSEPDSTAAPPNELGDDADEATADEAAAKTPDPVDSRRGSGDANRTSTESSAVHPKAARYVTAIYELNGVEMPTETHRNIPKLYRHCKTEDATYQSREPATGDLVFFHNVADANDDGRNNDWYTFVALVENVRESGAVELLAYRNGSVRNFTMNPSNPDRATDDAGERINSRLRTSRPDDPPYTRYLAGQLFAGYCSLLGDRSELLVVDNWQPGMELDPPEN